MNTRDLGKVARRRARARRRCLLPRLEPMEERVVPASLVANDVAGLVAAIVASNSNGQDDTITLVAGKTYTLTSVDNTVHGPTGLPVVGEAGYKVTIVGVGATITRDAAAPAFRLLDVAAGTTVELVGLTVTGGLAKSTSDSARGGGIYSQGDLTLVGVTVRGNRAQGTDWSYLGKHALGGGIHSQGGALTLTGGTRVEGNQALGGFGHTSDSSGTGGDARGGGVHAAGGTVKLTDGTSILANVATGGIGVWGYSTPVGGGRGAMGGNAEGGGLYLSEGTVGLVSAVNVAGNTATGGTGGTGGSGGYYFVHGGYLIVSAGGPGGNGGSASGGGLYLGASTVTLSRSSIVDNAATGGAGGRGGPGGWYFMPPFTRGPDGPNGASGLGRGGGLLNDAGGTLQLHVSTIANNTASHEGGALMSRAEATLWSCTVSGNSAGAAGGGILNTSALSLVSSIVAKNRVGAAWRDINGAVQPASYNNLIGVDSNLSGISAGVNGNLIGTSAQPIDPLLAPLGDYGGPTRTMALLPGSPAIDPATGEDIPAIDQRYMPRRGVADIGAFESQGFTLTVAPAGTPRRTVTGTAFISPLVVRVAANNPLEPVDGGVITFLVDPPINGASAVLSSPFAVIAGGEASVTAVANTIAGVYDVWAQCAGAAPTWFELENVLGSGRRGR